MQDNLNVSVIVLTYHPDFEKMRSTIISVLKQKGISFEIIISDDGSEEDYFKETEDFFQKHHFQNYTFVKNVENVGTVANIYGAVKKARGKYVFCTSPGDMIYDSVTLRDFFQFCEENQAKVAFGNAVYYNNDDENFQVFNGISSPHKPQVYKSHSIFIRKFRSFMGISSLGQLFFRETRIFRKYLKKILPHIRYIEDNATTARMLMDGVLVHYLDRKVVWYEYGAGISTGKESKWKQIIDNEIITCYEHLNKDYPESRMVESALYTRTNPMNLKNKMFRTIRFPLISAAVFYNSFMKDVNFHYDVSEERQKFNQIRTWSDENASV